MFSCNDTQNCTEDDDDYASIPDAVKFWVFLSFLIPSVTCSLFVLYYLLWNRTLHQALHNHAIIIFLFCGLIYQLTIYPWLLYYHHHEGIWKRSVLFCTIWAFIDWGVYYTQTILLAWATIERHILIFHRQWIVPLMILILYCSIYYVVTTFFPSCENHFDDYFTLCIELCAFHSVTLYRYDTIVHQIVPNLIIIICSITLLLRVRRQKKRVGKSLQWKKHWKMTIQLLFVSCLYLIFALPVTVMNFLHLCGLNHHATKNFMEYLLFFNYCMMLLCPFACALSLPQLREKIRSIIRLQQHTRVTPMTVVIRQTI